MAASSNASMQIRYAGAGDAGDAENQYRDGNERAHTTHLQSTI